jgi:hypothetical protein
MAPKVKLRHDQLPSGEFKARNPRATDNTKWPILIVNDCKPRLEMTPAKVKESKG